MFEDADKDKNGGVSWQEFKDWVQRRQAQYPQRHFLAITDQWAERFKKTGGRSNGLGLEQFKQEIIPANDNTSHTRIAHPLYSPEPSGHHPLPHNHSPGSSPLDSRRAIQPRHASVTLPPHTTFRLQTDDTASFCKRDLLAPHDHLAPA